MTLLDWIKRLGRPEAEPDDNIDLGYPRNRDTIVDNRLNALEKHQEELRARMRILEKAGNPRGIGRDDL